MTILLGRDDPSENPTLAVVQPDDLSAYLSSRGWRRVGEMHHMGRWVVPGQEDYQVLAPLDSGYADFKRRIYELVRDLSMIEDRSPDSVLYDLLTVRADTIRVRVRPRGAPNDTSIPLHDGAKLVEQARKLLVAAARSADKRQKSYLGALPGPVRQYLDRARLGQTEQGSYVVAITSPVSQPAGTVSQPSIFGEDEADRPLPLRVTQILASATRAARDTAEAVARHNAQLDRFRAVVQQGVSANLCDSLVGIGEVQEGGFTISFAWAPIREAPEPVTTVAFSDEMIPVFRDAAVLLRYVDEGPFVLQGRIKELEEDWERGPGRIGVIPVQGEPGEVWVRLGPDAYSRASLAHHRNERIRVQGTLIREGRRWELADPRDFTIIQARQTDRSGEEPE